MKPIIQVENLSKQYRIGARRAPYATLRDKLAEVARSPLKRLRGNSKGEAEVLWALRDVSFEVRRGEVLGIIGRNGAGKSTLLKILSRITEPTTGEVDLYGRVASLLEIGTGFHPELTGRENVYLNGAVLGMKKNEIEAKFAEIVMFAELEKFLDTPVKHYSSGMYMRLAFSVAAHLEPDVLIVDEVLAVGDMAFQHKCLGKMGDVARQGRTVLFVSHNLPAVQRLCSSAVYLDRGMIKAMGDVGPILTEYQRDSSSSRRSRSSKEDRDESLPEGRVGFVSWGVRSPLGDISHSCTSRDQCEFVFNLRCNRRILKARFGFALRDSEDQLILVGHSLDSLDRELDIEMGDYELKWVARLPLKSGSYQLTVSVATTEEGTIEEWLAEPQLVILPNLKTHLPEQWHGLLNENVDFVVAKTKGRDRRPVAASHK
jgi:lipopolysaccharide transport system ATP-binding protein